MEQFLTKNDKKPPKKVGRKPINIDIAKVEALASRNMGVMEICRTLGVGWDTFNKNRKRKTELSEAYERGRAKGLERATFRLMEQIDDGNFQAIQFYLKNTDSDKWKDRQEVVNATINLNDVLTGAKDRLGDSMATIKKPKVINAVKSTSTASEQLVNNQDDIKNDDNKGG
jgi:nucleotidyltransferase/DNA polymerase involved in DNA repair